MDNVSEILEIEEKFKKMLIQKLEGDERLSLSCPGFRYPEPVYVYIKCVKTEKSIAVRLDGGDKTMRFWDYADDDYSDEDGVWERMTEKGLETFIKKLYIVMDKAVDIEYYDSEGECADYYSGVLNLDFSVENARRAVKKYGKNSGFAIAKFSNFFGDVNYVFDSAFRQVVKR